MKKRMLSYSLLLSSVCLGVLAAPSKSAKVAIVDMRTILSQDPAVLKDDSKVFHEWRDLYNKLLSVSQPMQQEIIDLEALIQKKSKAFEEEGKEIEKLASVSSPEIIQGKIHELQRRAEAEIGPLYNNLQKSKTDVPRFMNEEFGKIQTTVLPKFQKAIDEVQKAQGWDFVVKKEMLASSLLDSSDFNITADVLKVLNANYAATKKQAAAKAK